MVIIMTRANWESISEGQTVTKEFGSVSITDIVKFQGASGDFHPAHHDNAYAIANGYPGVFSLGLLSAGYLTSMASDWLGPQNVRGFTARFRDVVWPGDLLSGELVIKRKYIEESERRVDLSLACYRDGIAVVLATATYVLPMVQNA